jgi:hypothetical protein
MMNVVGTVNHVTNTSAMTTYTGVKSVRYTYVVVVCTTVKTVKKSYVETVASVGTLRPTSGCAHHVTRNVKQTNAKQKKLLLPRK